MIHERNIRIAIVRRTSASAVESVSFTAVHAHANANASERERERETVVESRCRTSLRTLHAPWTIWCVKTRDKSGVRMWNEWNRNATREFFLTNSSHIFFLRCRVGAVFFLSLFGPHDI